LLGELFFEVIDAFFPLMQASVQRPFSVALDVQTVLLLEAVSFQADAFFGQSIDVLLGLFSLELGSSLLDRLAGALFFLLGVGRILRKLPQPGLLLQF